MWPEVPSVVRHKSLSFIFHSGLDPKSIVSEGIPAFISTTSSEFM
jgi:hypothetical protein